MKKILSLLTLATIIFSSCSKSSGGGNTTTDTYLPSTVGTSWTYNYSNAGAPASSVTYTMGSLSATVNGRAYKIAEASTGAANNRKFAQEGNSYWTTMAVTSASELELNILQSDKNLNDTWTNSQAISGLTGIPGGISSATINITYKITQKGGSYTVSGVSYNDVIKVEATSIQATLSGIPLPNLGTASFYFAKNIGLIKMVTTISNSTIGLDINDTYELQSYTIK